MKSGGRKDKIQYLLLRDCVPVLWAVHTGTRVFQSRAALPGQRAAAGLPAVGCDRLPCSRSAAPGAWSLAPAPTHSLTVLNENRICETDTEQLQFDGLGLRLDLGHPPRFGVVQRALQQAPQLRRVANGFLEPGARLRPGVQRQVD
jgi:hypothetical protein